MWRRVPTTLHRLPALPRNLPPRVVSLSPASPALPSHACTYSGLATKYGPLRRATSSPSPHVQGPHQYMRYHSTQAEEEEKRFREEMRVTAASESAPTPHELERKMSIQKEPVVAGAGAAEVTAHVEAAVGEEEGLTAVIGGVFDWISIDV